MATGYFSFSSSLRLVFSFVLFFLLLFFSFSLFSSHFPFISPHFLFSLFSFHFSPPIWRTLHIRSKEEIASPFPQTKGVALTFPYFSLISLFPFMTSCTQVVHCEPWDSFPHMANCESFLFMPSVTLFEVPCGISSPCHVSSDTPRLEKREIPTTSESNEIRRDC